jgi:outer membrane protein OmpA-like peptidoglycan-associated protein
VVNTAPNVSRVNRGSFPRPVARLSVQPEDGSNALFDRIILKVPLDAIIRQGACVTGADVTVGSGFLRSPNPRLNAEVRCTKHFPTLTFTRMYDHVVVRLSSCGPDQDRSRRSSKSELERQMSQRTRSWGTLAAAGAISLLSACAQTPPPAMVASNPPPVPPGPNATWYHVDFTTNSRVIDAKGQQTVSEVTTFLQQNPNTIATIIGKTDTVGSANYNMHLSHQRADAVRDALVYHSNISADRVETRWTGETRQRVASADIVPAEPNRVVDIAIH